MNAEACVQMNEVFFSILFLNQAANCCHLSTKCQTTSTNFSQQNLKVGVENIMVALLAVRSRSVFTILQREKKIVVEPVPV
jgi:hypothetical protein